MRTIRIGNFVIDASQVKAMWLKDGHATVELYAECGHVVDGVTQEAFDIAVRQFRDYLDNQK